MPFEAQLYRKLHFDIFTLHVFSLQLPYTIIRLHGVRDAF